ncbi:MAG: (5-formylfuran-3-yl)methyl phosphate synthase [Methanothermococcus sp.]|uniref:(5-formylfuran-3-yl)methyl phosphate synthase n=1 Tax=Methanothermococcus TaxID=155862 RepID=UPI0003721ACE|nr:MULTISPECIES: (5-formylfuran-3-yl)methyl phosphate synthase [Methanothermococcus]MDK2790001.1 (5-formylfuran-3-yl)methyl phosphate synthase [Methanothermococcus sp.]MDK2986904.1 (5-formylfuran-3-yl)methyl phosphate synthase [Methanothermococcus sp.]
MIILVSPKDVNEAIEAIEGGADIIDVKNPPEGSLGANFPWVIKQIKEVTPENRLVSATIGDVPYKPGTASLAALGACVSGADYIKVGLYGTKSYSQSLDLMEKVTKAVKDFDEKKIVVAAGYADAYRVGAVDPLVIPKIARDAGCDVAMLDTAVKDGKTLFDHLNEKLLEEFINETHAYGMKCALAGSIKKEEIPILKDIGCDIVGVRGAACTKGDRNEGRIQRNLVNELVKLCRD